MTELYRRPPVDKPGRKNNTRCVRSGTFARLTDDPDDPDSRHEGALARVLGSGEWAKLRAQVLEASVFQTIGWPLVKIGRFDALVCIGEGGFGTVFKARDPKLGRLVALKLCRTRSKDVVNGIMNEAMALAQLEHANIVTIFELGEHDGAVFFAMRYLAGKNAERFAERDPPPTCEEVLKVYRHVARGLAAAHAKKYVHGDIKPSNILLDTDDFAYIADFGLARRMIDDADESEREELRRRGGTMYYMAPEVLAGGSGDARSDQFSFFVALYQTLTGGKLPFYGKTSGEILDAIKHTDIRDLIDPSWPVALQVVLRIGLSLDPDERFPDMATVEAEIDRLLQPPPPSSPPRDEPEPDEPESDEPESPPDEPDEPERMHAPDSLDEPALMLGEAEVLVVEPPPLEPDLLLGESPAVEPEPMTLGPARAKRGTYAASLLLVGTVCLTLGWLGRGRVEGPRPVPSVGELGMPLPDHRAWTGGLASYSHAWQAIDRGDFRAGYDAWVAARGDVIRSTPRLEGELSLLLAKRVDERSPGNPDASWMANGAAESFEKAQSWRRAAEARQAAAELAHAANYEWQAAHQEHCALVNAMGRPCPTQ
jgi:serine/threonine protein kinase